MLLKLQVSDAAAWGLAELLGALLDIEHERRLAGEAEITDLVRNWVKVTIERLQDGGGILEFNPQTAEIMRDVIIGYREEVMQGTDVREELDRIEDSLRIYLASQVNDMKDAQKREAWERRDLGNDPRYAEVVSDEEGRLLDEAPGMQVVKIRMEKDRVRELDRIAREQGLAGHVVLIRNLVSQFVRDRKGS